MNEDPWKRLRKIKSKAKKTKLQMLPAVRISGYKHYADDVVKYICPEGCRPNGIDIIRIFDALNDPRNLEFAMKATKKEGGHAQGAVCYTISPFHDLEQFVRDAKGMVEAGADSICIKDMAGLLTPYKAYELVKALKENVKVPLQLHTHYTSGVASMTYLKAIEAGCDVVDCAISPMAMGTSQPPTEPMVATLQDTPYDTKYDLNLLSEIAEYFRPIKEQYMASGLMDAKIMGVDINTLLYGSRWNAFQPCFTAEAGWKIGKVSGSSERSSPGEGRVGLSSTGHAYKPNSWYPGSDERDCRRAL